MRHPFLIGERVYLRALEDSDVGDAYPQWLNDAEVCRFNSHHRFPATAGGARRFIEAAGNSRTELTLAIVLRGDNTHIGNVTLQKIDHISRNAEFAILVGSKEHWGKRYAREASELIVDHGFRELNLHRIYCGTDARNDGMRRLAAALGMREEGCRRDAIFKDGGFRDIVEFGVLRDEFYARAGAGQGQQER